MHAIPEKTSSVRGCYRDRYFFFGILKCKNSNKLLHSIPILNFLSVPQVTVHYEQKGGAVIPKRVHTIVISVQHDDFISLEEQKKVLKEKVECLKNAEWSAD